MASTAVFRADTAGSASRSVSAVTILCVAQLGMVIANLGRIPALTAGDRGIPFTVNDVLLAGILLVAVVVCSERRSLHLDRIGMTAVAFAVIGAGSAIWSVERLGITPFELLVALSYLARWLMYFGLYVAVINLVRDRDVERVWRALETMLVVFAAFGILQAALLPNFAQMVYPESRQYVDWDPQGHRLVSTVLEPNIAATMLMIGLLIQMARVSYGVEVSRAKLIILLIAFCLTLSRSGAIGLIVGSAMLFSVRGLSKRLARMFAVAAGLLLLASPWLLEFALQYSKFSFGEGSSAAARLGQWILLLQVIGDYPVFGVGFNAYKYAVRLQGTEAIGTASYGADGGLLFVMAMTGVVGLLVYCYMLWQVFARCRRLWRDTEGTSSSRAFGLGIAAATVAAVTQSAFVNALLTTYVMEILWLVWGLAFVLARQRSTLTDHSRSPTIVAIA
jgi:polysaccharide biosynthesis protein PslJ